eukprot:TRINITY_DN20965_c0_g1_i1.p1 TRINITY_DN20965_c0_g1~~TRINITY_DN20965_c0_g1_i1.p1  ORF type:complete len:654 (-),score=91.23 TRINITY_DN20965_c0_g1_i1:93-1994(-)
MADRETSDGRPGENDAPEDVKANAGNSPLVANESSAGAASDADAAAGEVNGCGACGLGNSSAADDALCRGVDSTAAQGNGVTDGVVGGGREEPAADGCGKREQDCSRADANTDRADGTVSSSQSPKLNERCEAACDETGAPLGTGVDADGKAPYAFTPGTATEEEFAKMSVKELKQCLGKRGVAMVGISEKSELVELMRRSGGLRSAAGGVPPAASAAANGAGVGAGTDATAGLGAAWNSSADSSAWGSPPCGSTPPPTAGGNPVPGAWPPYGSATPGWNPQSPPGHWWCHTGKGGPLPPQYGCSPHVVPPSMVAPPGFWGGGFDPWGRPVRCAASSSDGVWGGGPSQAPSQTPGYFPQWGGPQGSCGSYDYGAHQPPPHVHCQQPPEQQPPKQSQQKEQEHQAQKQQQSKPTSGVPGELGVARRRISASRRGSSRYVGAKSSSGGSYTITSGSSNYSCSPSPSPSPSRISGPRTGGNSSRRHKGRCNRSRSRGRKTQTRVRGSAALRHRDGNQNTIVKEEIEEDENCLPDGRTLDEAKVEEEELDEEGENMKAWLLSLDCGRGVLLRYLSMLRQEFGTLGALTEALLPQPANQSVVGRIDPLLWEALDVSALGHRLLLARGIVALSEQDADP